MNEAVEIGLRTLGAGVIAGLVLSVVWALIWGRKDD